MVDKYYILLLINARKDGDNMRKKYIVGLVAITIMFFIVLGIGTGYGVWIATKDKNDYNTTTLNCFKAFFSNGDTIEMSNIDSVVNEEGNESSPYTITVTNICDTQKELQVRLNIDEETTVDTTALTITAAGHIDQPITLYKNLSSVKTTDKKAVQSKIVGLISVEPNETVRTNIKLWFDERKSPTIPKEAIFKAKFELIDTESTIKASFGDLLVQNKNSIEKKKQPEFNNISTTEDGMYLIEDNNTKTYYYRGVVHNNYVNFANLLWRVVSVSDDHRIKLVLDKSALYQSYTFNNNYLDYTAFSYIYNYQKVNANVNDQLLNWYNNTIVNQGLDKYVMSSDFCNETNNSVRDFQTYFSAYDRLTTTGTPIKTCPQNTTDFGGVYTQKVGLLTADEIVMAGGSFTKPNYNYYLYNGEGYFTMTPATFTNNVASVFSVNNDGSLSTQTTNTVFGIRPVINILSTVTVSGSGSIEDPYTIDMEEE